VTAVGPAPTPIPIEQPDPFPPTTASERDPHYGDVRDLIGPGFLTHQVEVAGLSLCLRNLTHGDAFLLNSRTTPSSDWRLWAVATAVWMVDGHVVLGDHRVAPRLYKAFASLPGRTQKILFSLVEGLTRRRDRAIEMIEAFCLESSSRFWWRSTGGDLDKARAGVPSTQSLSMNRIQQVWVAFNHTEDRRLEDEHIWECAKLTASSMAPKGVQKIEQREARFQRRENDRRQRIMDSAFYWVTGKTNNPRALLEGIEQSGMEFSLKSVDTLEEEFRRWVVGDMDIHDQVVQAYKGRILEQRERHQRELEERRDQLRTAVLTESIQPVSLRGYTAAEVREMMNRRGGPIPGITVVYDEPKHEQLDKYLDEPKGESLVRDVGGRLVGPRVNLSPDGDNVTLTQRVSRPPAYTKRPSGGRERED